MSNKSLNNISSPLGDGGIIPLSEGTFTVDATKIFIPFEENDLLKNKSKGSLLVEVQPFLVITSNDIILIDTGLGFVKSGELQIYANLKQHNILPGDVTKVLMSHLHRDHSGGISMKDKLGNDELAFPNANYYVQRQEFDYAVDKGFPSYMAEELSVLEDNKNVGWLNGDEIIDGYIQCQVTHAHSKFHQVFWIVDGDKKIFYGADDAPQLHQLKNKFIAKYDYNGRKCMELRRQWWQQGNDENWIFLFYHDVKTPMYQSKRHFERSKAE